VSRETAFLVRSSLATGAVVAAVAFGAAHAGGGLAAFFVVVAVAAPLAVMVEHALARRAGFPGHFGDRARRASGRDAGADGRGEPGGS
jgi:hypothetical protein